MPEPETELFAENARLQGVVIRALLRAEDETTREALLDALRRTLPSSVRVYYECGLRVYYDHNPNSLGYPFSKHLSFSAVYIEEVHADGSGRITKGLMGPSKLPQTTEPKRMSALDYILQDDD